MCLTLFITYAFLCMFKISTDFSVVECNLILLHLNSVLDQLNVILQINKKITAANQTTLTSASSKLTTHSTARSLYIYIYTIPPPFTPLPYINIGHRHGAQFTKLRDLHTDKQHAHHINIRTRKRLCEKGKCY